MRYAIDAFKAKEVESNTINNIGVPSLVLMERAALFVYEESLKLYETGAVAFCGMGNNGADGIAAARMLLLDGKKTLVVMVGDISKQSLENKTQLEIYTKLGGEPLYVSPANMDLDDVFENVKSRLSDFNLIIDGLFGIGLSREVGGVFRKIIEFINKLKEDASDKYSVLSVDIASGLSTDTGLVLGAAVKADYTYTFGYSKLGHLIGDGLKYTGKLLCKDIGIVQDENIINSETGCQVLEEEDSHKLLPVRDIAGNKGTFGKVLVVAGCDDMPGAGILASKSAFKAGCGMVKLLTSCSDRTSLMTALPEAMATVYGQDFEEDFKAGFDFSDICIIGPGLGKSDLSKKVLEYTVLNYTKTLIIDADGLNILSDNIELLAKRLEAGYKTIITPHPGEFKRLFGIKDKEYQDVNYCKEIASKYGLVLVAKDARTIVTDGRQAYINISGSDALATAGSGDVLTGIIAAMVLGNKETLLVKSVAYGVYLHGAAGSLMGAEETTYSVTASDIIEGISRYINQVIKG